MILLDILFEFDEYIKNKDIKDILIKKLVNKSKFQIDDRKFVIYFNYSIFIEDKKEVKKVCFLTYRFNKIINDKTNKTFVKLEFYISDEDTIEKLYSSNSERNYSYEDVVEFRDKIIENCKNFKYQILEDTLSKYLLVKSYTLVFAIENSMRKLIFLMLSFFSEHTNWWQNEILDEIKNQIPDNRQNRQIYGTDFKHLSQILFKRVDKNKSNRLFEKIESLTKCQESDLKKLKKLLPLSNWKKYFDEIAIESIKEISEVFYNKEKLSNSEILEKFLEDIQKMRNDVAHNNINISSDFYEELNQRKYYFDQWINNALSDIELRTKEKISEYIKNSLSNENNKLINKIDELIVKIKNILDIEDEKDVKKYLHTLFYDDIEEENDCDEIISNKKIRDDIEYKQEIKDIIHFIIFKERILSEDDEVISFHLEKYIYDIDRLISKIELILTINNKEDENLEEEIKEEL